MFYMRDSNIQCSPFRVNVTGNNFKTDRCSEPQVAMASLKNSLWNVENDAFVLK